MQRAERTTGTPPAIVAEHLTFQPAGPDGPTPIHDLTFTVPPCHTLLLAGPTGAGKSLLLSLIAGLGAYHPDPHASGRLLIGDEKTTDLPTPRPGEVGYVQQQPLDGLLGFDVLGALAFPLETQGHPPAVVQRRIEAALRHYDVEHLADRAVATLSGGERRRVALAGVEALDPPLVLLDEPLAELDPAGVQTALADLVRLRRDRTVVIAEHRPEAAHLADQTLHLLPPRAPGPDAPLPVTVPAHDAPPRLTVRNLTLHRGGRTLVSDGRLVLSPGAYGLIGPNGAGKSTLLETLAGLRPPVAGDVTVDGVPVWHAQRRMRRARRLEKTLRQRLQATFQDPREAFFAAEVRDEVVAGRRALGVEGPDLLEAAGLAPLAHQSPFRLSGGEARLVATLSALAVAPRVLFLDEPSHGLDTIARTRLARTLARFADAGGIVVVATHEPDLLPADAAWLMLPGDGRLLTGSEAIEAARAAGYRMPVGSHTTEATP